MAIKPYTIVGSYPDSEVPWVVIDIVHATDVKEAVKAFYDNTPECSLQRKKDCYVCAVFAGARIDRLGEITKHGGIISYLDIE